MVVYPLKRMIDKVNTKHLLKTNYGITNRTSFYERLNDYENFSTKINMSILFDWYLENPEQFLSLSNQDMSERLTDDYLKQKIQKYVRFSYLKEKEEYLKDLYFYIKDEYVSDKLLYHKFFSENQLLLLMSPDLMGIGFDKMRQISFTEDAYRVGFINEQEAHKVITDIGIEIETLFHNWDEYFASVLIGKIYLTDYNGMVGQRVTDVKQVASGIYDVLTLPTMKELRSLIWEEDSNQVLVPLLESQYIVALEDTDSSEKKRRAIYPKNYHHLIDGKDSAEILPLHEKADKKRIKKYDDQLKSLITWKKVTLFFIFLGLSIVSFTSGFMIRGILLTILTCIIGFYLYIIGTPIKLYKKGTVIPGIVINLQPVKILIIAPLNYTKSKQRWGVKVITLPNSDISFDLREKVPCVAEYGNYEKGYYVDYTAHPLVFGFSDPTILEKAEKKMIESEIYPKNMEELLSLVEEELEEYSLQSIIQLDEDFRSIDESK